MKVVQKDYPKKQRTLWIVLTIMSILVAIVAFLGATKLFFDGFSNLSELKVLWQHEGLNVIPTNSLVMVGTGLILLFVFIFCLSRIKVLGNQVKFVKAFELGRLVDMRVVEEAPAITYSYQMAGRVKNDMLKVKSVERRTDIKDKVYNAKRRVVMVPKNDNTDIV